MPGRNKQYSPLNADYRYAYNGMEQDNEVSGNGNSYTTEFRQYDPRLMRWKSLDPLMQIFPSISPYCAFDNNPIYYTDPFGLASTNNREDRKEKKGNRRAHREKSLFGNKEKKCHNEDNIQQVEEVTASAKKIDPSPTGYEAAHMSKDSYQKSQKINDEKGLVGGWKVSPMMEKLMDRGIEFQNSETGFKSVLYERTIGNKTVYSYVFAGTDDFKDVSEDIAHAVMGMSAQVPQALINTQVIIKEIGNSNDLSVGGHSLGGGLANCAAMKYGLKSITFNPLWPSNEIIDKYQLNVRNQEDIINFVLLNDIVNTTQSFSRLFSVTDQQKVGTSIPLAAPNFTTGPIDAHLIETVIRSMVKMNLTKTKK